jgi:hypothetical protein
MKARTGTKAKTGTDPVFLILAILGVIAVVLFIHVDILVGLIFGGIALGIWMWKTGWVFW